VSRARRGMGPLELLAGVRARLTGVGLAKTVAALSFTTVLGVVPLFTVAFAYVARYPLFERWLEALERFLLRHMLPGSGAIVRQYLQEFVAKSAALQGVSIALVLLTALLLAATIEREINAIWDAREPRSAVARLLVAGFGITIGPLLIGAAVWSTSWLLEMTFDNVPWAARALPGVATPIAVALGMLAFALLYKLVPARPVRWGAAFAGAAVAALAFEAAKRGFAAYVTSVPTYQAVYGALAALPLFLVWIYLAWFIILSGAAITATLMEGPPRGRRR
jgi:membrane protein